MCHVLLIIFFLIDISSSQNPVLNGPILIASPYPFNRSESSVIECFSNDQGIILSMTIIASMLDIDKNTSSLKSDKTNITNNGSITLKISAPFNYSQLHSKIECRSKYHHGEQKTNQLEVLSVAEIPQKDFLSLNTYTKQMTTIHCLTYGTNVSIHWDFSSETSKDTFGPLPIGTRFQHKFTINDTLIIDHVSYSDHRGYYRCQAKNELLDITYEDQSITYLKIQKNTIWIPIVVVCILIGTSILMLILCSKYCQNKRKNQLKAKENVQNDEEMIDEMVPSRESMEFLSDYNRRKSSEQILKNIEASKIQEENVSTLSHAESSVQSQISELSMKKEQRLVLNSLSTSKTSRQFVLGNPFIDPNVQPVFSIKQHINKF